MQKQLRFAKYLDIKAYDYSINGMAYVNVSEFTVENLYRDYINSIAHVEGITVFDLLHQLQIINAYVKHKLLEHEQQISMGARNAAANRVLKYTPLPDDIKDLPNNTAGVKGILTEHVRGADNASFLSVNFASKRQNYQIVFSMIILLFIIGAVISTANYMLLQGNSLYDPIRIASAVCMLSALFGIPAVITLIFSSKEKSYDKPTQAPIPLYSRSRTMLRNTMTASVSPYQNNLTNAITEALFDKRDEEHVSTSVSSTINAFMSHRFTPFYQAGSRREQPMLQQDNGDLDIVMDLSLLAKELNKVKTG